jgi:hypothetical protein
MESNKSDALSNGIHTKYLLLLMLQEDDYCATVSQISNRVQLPSTTIGPLLVALEESDWVKISEAQVEPTAGTSPGDELYSLTDVGRSGALGLLRQTSSEVFFELAATLGLSRHVLNEPEGDSSENH